MGAFAIKILVFLATAYLAVLAILVVMQSRLIYPAPQQLHLPAPGFGEVSLDTSDGLTLNAHWRAPDAGRPTIVWFHGNGGSLAGATNETRLVSEHGYGLLLVNYRGYGGNPGEPSEEGFYKDGRAAMAFLEAQGIAVARTVIAGNSIGSGTAVQMASEHDVAALMLISPFTSLTDAASDALPIFPVRLLLRDRFDNSAKFPALDLPILVLHGDADGVVPYEHGEALAKSNPAAQFVGFPGAGHDLTFLRRSQAAQLAWLADRGL
ncbi:MAG: alpha/beta hydrolase [Pseudomonadota bacterium]